MPGVVSTPGAKGRSGGFRGAGGHSYIESYVEECPTEGGNCVERNGSERLQVASVAKRKPPASPGYRPMCFVADYLKGEAPRDHRVPGPKGESPDPPGYPISIRPQQGERRPSGWGNRNFRWYCFPIIFARSAT